MDNREIAQAACRRTPCQPPDEVVVINAQAAKKLPEDISQVIEQTVQQAKDQAENIAQETADKAAEKSSACVSCQSRV